MKYLGSIAIFTVLTAVGLIGTFDIGGLATRMHNWGRSPQGPRYPAEFGVGRRLMFAFVTLCFLVILGFGVAAAAGWYVAPDR